MQSSAGSVRPCMPNIRLPDGGGGLEPERAMASSEPVPEQSGKDEAQRPRGRPEPGTPTPEELDNMRDKVFDITSETY